MSLLTSEAENSKWVMGLVWLEAARGADLEVVAVRET